jgi:ferredoxin
MQRDIIKIDEEKCNGCGECISHCPEGAIQLIEGKARLISDRYCDGLGACIGECPQGAIEVETREAQPYDEREVMATNVEKGRETNKAPLRHWPVQLHLINPRAQQYRKADLLVAADCTAFTLGSFHSQMLPGKSLVVACPKLDSGQEQYLEKLVALIDEAVIDTITVLIMEVPCCAGLVNLVQTAVSKAERKVPVKKVVAGIKGDIVQETWL